MCPYKVAFGQSTGRTCDKVVHLKLLGITHNNFLHNYTEAQPKGKGEFCRVTSFDKFCYSRNLFVIIDMLLFFKDRPEYNRTLALLQERVVRVETGETAIIPPYIGPGRWHSRYHIDWFMNHTLVGRVDGRRTPINGLLPERYSVNIGDFSLGIQSVARSDAGRYVGELGVTEVSTPYHYSPRRSTKLLVYGKRN